MLLNLVGIAFLLLFGVLIVDGMSTSFAATSERGTDVTTRSRKSEAEATAPTAIDGSRRFGERRPDDGTELAA
ncbi:hypothetical protein [Mycobacterium sp.]|uniref:hypothetical protein n=1 Tax=Mycobacterium sp. TaxID=1785 RepID=UPI003D1191AE